MTKTSYFALHSAALRMFVENPLTGVGPGRFGARVYDFATPEELDATSPWFAELRDAARRRPEIAHLLALDPHSTWLGWAAETGLGGLLGWLAVFGWLLRSLSTPPEQLPSEGDGLRHLALPALWAFLLAGFHMEIAHLKFVWAFLGVAIGASETAGTSHLAGKRP